jgi:hypothetical protein
MVTLAERTRAWWRLPAAEALRSSALRCFAHLPVTPSTAAMIFSLST